MKNMTLKKITALALSAVFALCAFTACSGNSSSAPAQDASTPAAAGASDPADAQDGLKEVTVGLIQLMEHPSLDEIRTAIEARLEERPLKTAFRSTSITRTARATPARSTPSASSLWAIK